MHTKKSDHCNSVYCHKAQPFQSIPQQIINNVKWPIFCEHCIEHIVRYRKSLRFYFLLESIIYCKYCQFNESRWIYSFSCIIPMPIVSNSTEASNTSQRVTSCKWAGLMQGFFFPVVSVMYLQIWWAMKRDSEPLYYNRSVTQAQECLWWIGI